MFNDTADAMTVRLRATLRGETPVQATITLANASALLAGVGMDIVPRTLRHYASGQREPVLPAVKVGKTWYVRAETLYRWLVDYLKAPAIGRRTRS